MTHDDNHQIKSEQRDDLDDAKVVYFLVFWIFHHSLVDLREEEETIDDDELGSGWM